MKPFAEIRFAAPDEQAALDELHRISSFVWPEDRANLAAHPDALGVSADAIAERRVRIAIADNGVPLGFATTTDAGGGALELEDLFVHPDAMRTGIGRRLVEDAAEIGLRGGFESMTVVAHPRNFPFYENVGFVAGDAEQTRFGPAVRMTRSLARGG